MLRQFAWLTLLVVTGMITGCGQSPDQSSGTAVPETPDAGSAVNPAANQEPTPAPEGQSESPDSAETTMQSNPVSLETMTWDETLELVDGQRGKVVVVDLWSTSCPPCLQELPNLVQLSKDFPEAVSCISVALDYAGYEDEPVESYRNSVLSWLTKFNAQIQNVLCSTDSNTIYSKKIAHASLPVVLVYDQSGTLVGQYPDPKDPAEFTYREDIIPFVRNLINQ